MKIKPINVVIGLIIYFVVEDFALKFLPVPNMLYTLLRFAGEIFLYFFVGLLMLNRRRQGREILKSPLDYYFLAFALAIIIAGLVNLSPFFYTVYKVRILFRYVAGFYLIMQLTITEEELRKLLRALIGIGVVQVLIGAWQHFVERQVSTFWMPREVDLIVGGVAKNFRSLEGLDAGIIIGTMVMPGQLATFFMIIATLLVCFLFYKRDKFNLGIFNKKWVFYAALLLLLGGTFISYSRASILMVGLAFPLAANFSGNVNKLVQFGILLLTVIVLAATVYLPYKQISSQGFEKEVTRTSEKSPLDELTYGFSLEYIQGEASNNRLWVIQHVGGIVLSEFKFFGYGTWEEQVRFRMYKDGVPHRIMTYKPFKDVYWMNMLAHFGIFGVTIFVLLLVRIYRMAKWVYYQEESDLFRFLALFMRVLIIIFALKTFFLSTFEYRPIGLIFWTLVGVLTVRYLTLKKAAAASTEA